MRWAREQFLNGGSPDAACPEVIDVTGRARILVFGPYAPLESGAWRARASLDLCPDAARCRLAVQFGIGVDFATVDIPRGTPGRHEIDIDYVSDTGGQVELRLVLMRAAFHGEVRFHGAEVHALKP